MAQLVTQQDTQPPAETLAENDADMSWVDIAVIRNGAVICDAAPGWLPFLHGDIHVEDVFASTVDYPTAPGLYRWSGYTVGSWEEGDGCVATGGTFTALTRRAGGDAIPAGIDTTVYFTCESDGSYTPHFSFPKAMRPDDAIETVRLVGEAIAREVAAAPKCPLHSIPKLPAGGDAIPEYAPDDISQLEGLASYLDGYARDKGRAGLPASKRLFEEVAKRLREYDALRTPKPAAGGDAGAGAIVVENADGKFVASFATQMLADFFVDEGSGCYRHRDSRRSPIGGDHG